MERERERSEREDRKARIKELWNEITSGRLVPSKETAEILKESELVRSLSELADKQKDEIHYLTQFERSWDLIRDHYPEEWENLYTKTLMDAVMPHIKKLVADQRPKERYERKRRGYKWGGVGEIESQFGHLTTIPSLLGPPSIVPPSCLDEIFDGGGVNMWRLQKLFGMNRNRFPAKLQPFKKGREELYDFRSVVEIMDALLSDPRELKRSAPGRRLRLWLSDADLRASVLNGIEVRINSRPVSKKIANAFLRIVRRYWPNIQ